MKKSIKNLSQRFDNVFKKISEKSGIDLESLEKEKKGVNDRLSNIKTLKQFLENITSSSKDIHELILKLKRIR